MVGASARQAIPFQLHQRPAAMVQILGFWRRHIARPGKPLERYGLLGFEVAASADGRSPRSAAESGDRPSLVSCRLRIWIPRRDASGEIDLVSGAREAGVVSTE